MADINQQTIHFNTQTTDISSTTMFQSLAMHLI